MNLTMKYKPLRLIISLFACLAILFAFVMQPYVAYAAWYNEVGYWYTTHPFAEFVVKTALITAGGVAGNSVFPGAGAVCGSILGEAVEISIAEIMSRWAENSSAYEQQFYAAEAQEIQNTPSYQVPSQSGSMLVPATISDSDISVLNQLESDGYIEYSYSPGNLNCHVLQNRNSMSYKEIRFNFVVPYGKYSFSGLGEIWGGYPNFYLYTPTNGDIYNLSGVESTTSYVSYNYDRDENNRSIGIYNKTVGFTNYTMYSGVDYIMMGRVNWIFTPGSYFGFQNLFLNITGSSLTSSPKSARISSIGLAAAQINNDNSINYNFALGKTDARGNVNLIYDPNIFDEDTNRFSDPITGGTYTATDWQYFYDPDCRGYVLNFVDGVYTYNNTDVDHVYLLYANDALYIMGFDDEGLEDAQDSGNYSTYAIFSEKFDYVIGHKSTGDDTGNDPGTIVDPGTDPGNDPGTGTGTGTGGDNSGGSGSVSSIWEKLGNFLGGIVDGITGFFTAVLGSFLDALIDLGEVIHDRLSALLDMVLEWFDTIPQLFGGFLAFLSALFPFLPAEIIMMLEFGLAAAIVVGLIRLVRR